MKETNRDKPELSIVIPCYNEAENIPLILKRFSEVINNLNAEVILVNNGSTDNSQEILTTELKKPEYHFARTILVEKNIGYGHGIMFGLKQAKADIIAYTHADMQCDPYDTIKGYHIISQKENPEKHLIKGWRRKRELVPQILTSGFQVIAHLLYFKKFNEINAQPKIFHKNFLNKLTHPPINTNLDFYILYKAKKEKLKTISFPVDFPERKHGESKNLPNPLAKLRVIRGFLKYLFKLRFLGEEKAIKK